MHWKRAITKRGMLALNENLSRIKTMMKLNNNADPKNNEDENFDDDDAKGL